MFKPAKIYLEHKIWQIRTTDLDFCYGNQIIWMHVKSQLLREDFWFFKYWYWKVLTKIWFGKWSFCADINWRTEIHFFIHNKLTNLIHTCAMDNHNSCCDPDATTWKLDGSRKDSNAKPLCELTTNKQCSFHQPNQV